MEKASKTNNYHYNIKLRNRAKTFRRKGTKSEAYMWKFILSKNSMGFKFLRQRPVLYYIADFMCMELLLIIKCDGASHLLEGADIKDAKGQKALGKIGFKVLRFEDSIVLNNLNTTATIIEQEIELRKKELGLV